MCMIKLNIGGYKFFTSSETLLKYEQTFFSALLTGRIPSLKDEEGAYFIDRDGQFFAPILTWLRTSDISFPEAQMTMEDLMREAKYYGFDALIEELTQRKESLSEDKQTTLALECPSGIEQHVQEYFKRHEKSIMGLLRDLNNEGHVKATIQIIPGHKQDIERPPQMLPSGRLGLYMNFKTLPITNYTRVQFVLGSCFKEKGFSGYCRPGELIELWWAPPDHRRELDIVYFQFERIFYNL